MGNRAERYLHMLLVSKYWYSLGFYFGEMNTDKLKTTIKTNSMKKLKSKRNKHHLKWERRPLKCSLLYRIQEKYIKSNFKSYEIGQ